MNLYVTAPIFLVGLILSHSSSAEPKKIICESKNPHLASVCPELEFTNRNTIVLDTDDLTAQGSTAEMERWNCSSGSRGVSRNRITATSTTISLDFVSGGDIFHFNIDRTDLSGGVNADRSWRCRIEDVAIDRKI